MTFRRRALVADASTFHRAYRGGAAGKTGSLADQGGAEVFADEAPDELIRTALAQNHDVGIASRRILQAQANARITRAGMREGHSPMNGTWRATGSSIENAHSGAQV